MQLHEKLVGQIQVADRAKNCKPGQVRIYLILRSAYHQILIAEKDRFTAFEACGELWEFTRIPFGVTNGVPAFQREIDNLIQAENLKNTFPYLDYITVAGRTKEEHDQNVKRFLEALQRRNWILNEKKTLAL